MGVKGKSRAWLSGWRKNIIGDKDVPAVNCVFGIGM